MGLHQTKKLLYIKGNNQQDEETAHKTKKILANCSSDKVLISRI
jgi:hypothetical protein